MKESGTAARLASLVPTLLSLATLAVAGLLSLQAMEGGASAKPPADTIQPPAAGVRPVALASMLETSTVIFVVDSEARAESVSRLRSLARRPGSGVALEFMAFHFDASGPGAARGLLVEAIRELMQVGADFEVIDLRVSN